MVCSLVHERFVSPISHRIYVEFAPGNSLMHTFGSMGGWVAPEIKYAGFDGLIIRGKVKEFRRSCTWEKENTVLIEKQILKIRCWK